MHTCSKCEHFHSQKPSYVRLVLCSSREQCACSSRTPNSRRSVAMTVLHGRPASTVWAFLLLLCATTSPVVGTTMTCTRVSQCGVTWCLHPVMN